MKNIKGLFENIKNAFLNKWFCTGLLVIILLFIIVVLYILHYQPFAFIYSAF